ncbi:hypothetical protein AGMMS50256_37130 [Betaproteobacteria bacterium]|nr:hypothetical protein AGMMS50256_37130 [Betaproteobacteria bacterium]
MPAQEGLGGWEEPSAFTLRGFGTLGLARSTNGQAEMRRNLLQPRGISKHWSARGDSDFGLQLNYLASDTVEATAQVVSRYGSDGNFKPELTELLVRYDPNAYFSLRGGRICTEFFMHGDSHLIGYSQLAARPNIDYISTLAVTYLDGADAQVTLPLGDGLLRGKLYYGFLGEKFPFLGSNPNSSLNLRGSRLIGTYLDYQEGNWQWRGGMARARFKHQLQGLDDVQSALVGVGAASAARALDLQGTEIRYDSIGVVYDRAPLRLQVMLGRLRFDSKVVQGQDSAMFQAGYRIGELTPFIAYSRLKSRRTHVATGLPDEGIGALVNAGMTSYLEQTFVDQHTVSLGLRWDFQRNMALKFQADRIRGDADSRLPLARATSRWNGKTNIFTLALDFVF